MPGAEGRVGFLGADEQEVAPNNRNADTANAMALIRQAFIFPGVRWVLLARILYLSNKTSKT
jgi:hypothetical protein